MLLLPGMLPREHGRNTTLSWPSQEVASWIRDGADPRAHARPSTVLPEKRVTRRTLEQRLLSSPWLLQFEFLD